MEFVVPDLWIYVIGGFIPLLTAAIAKAEAGDNVRRAIAVVLAAVLAVVNTLVDSGGASSTAILFSTFIAALGSQIGAYLIVWQGLNVNSRVLPKVGVMR